MSLRTFTPLRRLAPVALLLLAGCAAGGWSRSQRVSGDEVVVEVQNDLVPARSVTVWMISEAGPRTLLGSVPAGQTRILRFRQQAFNGAYRLSTGSGRRQQDGTVSTPFTLSAGALLVWSVRPNVVRFVAPS